MGLHSIGPSSPQHYRIAETLEEVGGIQCRVVLLYSSYRGQPDFLKKIIIKNSNSGILTFNDPPFHKNCH